MIRTRLKVECNIYVTNINCKYCIILSEAEKKLGRKVALKKRIPINIYKAELQ